MAIRSNKIKHMRKQIPKSGYSDYKEHTNLKLLEDRPPPTTKSGYSDLKNISTFSKLKNP